MNLIEELQWRGMLHTMTPEAESHLLERPRVVYAGFDPTAPSLQIGNLAPLMQLLHFQRAGHTPIILLGGATGMIGDPSGKSSERILQSPETIHHNLERFSHQLSKLLDFTTSKNPACIVNNNEWIGSLSLIDFLRDTGKHLTVGYMLAKDSVKSRLETGLSFTEFSYQLIQGFDFHHLFTTKNCTVQIGGSDQWGNITAGIELIRRTEQQEAHALTCPLVTRSDGTKFGKSAQGEALWLDATMTSPYRFYQFWLNQSDEDAAGFLRLFTLLTPSEINILEEQHREAPHRRILQKALARDVTIRIHSEDDFHTAIEAAEILFGKGCEETLRKLPEQDFLAIFDGVPRSTLSRDVLARGLDVVELLTTGTGVFSSRSEARRMITGGGVSLNKQKVTDCADRVSIDRLLSEKYLVVQRGKKNYHLILVL